MLGKFATASRHTAPILILHCHSPGDATVARRCASMSTTTTTTTRDRGDCYGPVEWAQQIPSLRNRLSRDNIYNNSCWDSTTCELLDAKPYFFSYPLVFLSRIQNHRMLRSGSALVHK